MAVDRHVVLGLARARSPWFAEVGRWATSGVLAIDFVKTVSVDQVRARLASGRPFSALLVDGGLPGLDRDLFEAAIERKVAVIVVADDEIRDWGAIGAIAVVPSRFSVTDLTAVLAAHATPVDRLDRIPGTVPAAPLPTGFRAQVVAVTGAGGTGASVIAAGVAQGLAADVAHAGTTLLADLALHADQGVLHDAGDVIPGLLELVERHRGGDPTADVVRSMTFDIVERRYRLLLGLRRHREWTALRPSAVRAAIDGLRRAFTLVVTDIDSDFEGETATGSVDVEDRNRLSRTALALSDAVVVVGAPGIAGIHGMLRVVRDCIDAGCAPAAVLPVINRAPRRGRGRAELVAAVTEFLSSALGEIAVLSPTLVPERAEVELALRDGTPLPAAVVDPVTAVVRRRLDSAYGPPPLATSQVDETPVPVAIGSLGDWLDEEQLEL